MANNKQNSGPYWDLIRKSKVIALNKMYIKEQDDKFYCEVCKQVIELDKKVSNLIHHCYCLKHNKLLTENASNYLSKFKNTCKNIQNCKYFLKFVSVLAKFADETKFMSHIMYMSYNRKQFICVLCNVSVHFTQCGKNVRSHFFNPTHLENAYMVHSMRDVILAKPELGLTLQQDIYNTNYQQDKQKQYMKRKNSRCKEKLLKINSSKCPKCGEDVEIYNEDLEFSIQLHMQKHKNLSEVNATCNFEHINGNDNRCTICLEFVPLFNRDVELSMNLHYEEYHYEEKHASMIISDPCHASDINKLNDNEIFDVSEALDALITKQSILVKNNKFIKKDKHFYSCTLCDTNFIISRNLHILLVYLSIHLMGGSHRHKVELHRKSKSGCNSNPIPKNTVALPKESCTKRKTLVMSNITKEVRCVQEINRAATPRPNILGNTEESNGNTSVFKTELNNFHFNSNTQIYEVDQVNMYFTGQCHDLPDINVDIFCEENSTDRNTTERNVGLSNTILSEACVKFGSSLKKSEGIIQQYAANNVVINLNKQFLQIIDQTFYCKICHKSFQLTEENETSISTHCESADHNEILTDIASIYICKQKNETDISRSVAKVNKGRNDLSEIAKSHPFNVMPSLLMYIVSLNAHFLCLVCNKELYRSKKPLQEIFLTHILGKSHMKNINAIYCSNTKLDFKIFDTSKESKDVNTNSVPHSIGNENTTTFNKIPGAEGNTNSRISNTWNAASITAGNSNVRKKYISENNTKTNKSEMLTKQLSEKPSKVIIPKDDNSYKQCTLSSLLDEYSKNIESETLEKVIRRLKEEKIFVLNQNYFKEEDGHFYCEVCNERIDLDSRRETHLYRHFYTRKHNKRLIFNAFNYISKFKKNYKNLHLNKYCLKFTLDLTKFSNEMYMSHLMYMTYDENQFICVLCDVSVPFGQSGKHVKHHFFDPTHLENAFMVHNMKDGIGINPELCQSLQQTMYNTSDPQDTAEVYMQRTSTDSKEELLKGNGLKCLECTDNVVTYKENIENSLQLHQNNVAEVKIICEDKQINGNDNLCPICKKVVPLFTENVELSMNLHHEDHHYEEKQGTTIINDPHLTFDINQLHMVDVFDVINVFIEKHPILMKNKQFIKIVDQYCCCTLCNINVMISRNLHILVVYFHIHFRGGFHKYNLELFNKSEYNSNTNTSSKVVIVDESSRRSKHIAATNVTELPGNEVESHNFAFCQDEMIDNIEEEVVTRINKFDSKGDMGITRDRNTSTGKYHEYFDSKTELIKEKDSLPLPLETDHNVLESMTQINISEEKKENSLSVNKNSTIYSGKATSFPDIKQLSKIDLVISLNDHYLKAVEENKYFCNVCQEVIEFNENGHLLKIHCESTNHNMRLTKNAFTYVFTLDDTVLGSNSFGSNAQCIDFLTELSKTEPFNKITSLLAYISYNVDHFVCLVCNKSLSLSISKDNILQHFLSKCHKRKAYEIDCCLIHPSLMLSASSKMKLTLNAHLQMLQSFRNERARLQMLEFVRKHRVKQREVSTTAEKILWKLSIKYTEVRENENCISIIDKNFYCKLCCKELYCNLSGFFLVEHLKEKIHTDKLTFLKMFKQKFEYV